MGARVELASGGLFPEFVLFGEDAGRIIVSCDPGNLARIKDIAGKNGIVADAIGETVQGRIEILLDGKPVISAAISELSNRYEGALEAALKTDPELLNV